MTTAQALLDAVVKAASLPLDKYGRVRTHCPSGQHAIAEGSWYLDIRAQFHCRGYERDTKARAREASRRWAEAQKGKDPPKPVKARFRPFELHPSQGHLRGLAAIKVVHNWFFRQHNHEPSIILCSEANQCRYRDVTVREPIKGLEPPVTDNQFLCR